MQRTFKAVCPATKQRHVFEIVSEQGKTVGWCTRCRQSWPMSELHDGPDEKAADTAPDARAPRRRSSVRTK